MGQTITITGRAFGEDCYDVRSPDFEYPAGGGVLGRPGAGLEVVVTQGSASAVLAVGNANIDYGFRVSAPVPVNLQPGPAQVFMRSSGHPPLEPVTLTITDAPTGVAQTIATFGPEDRAVVPQVVEEPSATGPWMRAIVGTLVAAALGGVSLTFRARVD